MEQSCGASAAEMAEKLEELVGCFEGNAEWIEGEIYEKCEEKVEGVSVEARTSEGVYRVEIDVTSRGDIEDEHSLSVEPQVIVNSIVAMIEEHLEGGAQ